MRLRPLVLSLSAILSSAIAAAIVLTPAAAAVAHTSVARHGPTSDAAIAPYAASDTQVRMDANDFTIDSFDAAYDLGRDENRDSTLSTTETIVADFPQSDQSHGIERALPQHDQGTDLQVHVTSVTDGAGHDIGYSTSTDDDDFLVLRIGDAHRYVHGTQTYVIRYTSRSVVQQFPDTHDAELYWDVNGNGWAQSIAHVTATVHLRDGIASDLTGDLSCYAGSNNGSGSCPISRAGDTITAHDAAVSPYSTMTFAIGFRADAFAARPLIRDNPFYAIVPWVLLGLFLLAGAWVLVLRLGPWRDARGRGIIVAEYAAPKGMYPALAAEILRRRQRALSAQIVRFAVNGVVTIREYPDAITSARYELTLVDPKATVLQPDETDLLAALFGAADEPQPGATVRLDRADTGLGARLVARAGDALKTAKARGVLQRPPYTVARWLTIGLAVLGACAIAHLIVTALNDGATGWTWLLDFIVFFGSIVFTILSVPRLRITEAGAAPRDQLKGLREYISLAEADRIRMLQEPSTAERIDATDRSAVIKLYEKLLPYAMVWGIEKEWIRELERSYGTDATPDWYAGSNSLIGLAAMSSVVSTGPSASGASWSASSGSSSFGGSSGGGFSGGGGGGGGGGGW